MRRAHTAGDTLDDSETMMSERPEELRLIYVNQVLNDKDVFVFSEILESPNVAEVGFCELAAA